MLIGSIQVKDGDVKHDRVEIANVFAEFYKELYEDVEKVLIKANVKNILDHSALDSITKEEVAEQLKDMKRGKGADVDGFFADIVKDGGDEIHEELASIFNDVLKRLTLVPKYWKSSKITVLFKKGSRSTPSHFR